MRILLIDDDEQLMEVLASKLIEQRYAVDIANTGTMGWEFILLFSYDLVVLDWMLPDLDGVALCRKIRAEGYKMPIILLTARDRYTDKVLGLDAGADDYVVKPFNFDVLTAKLRALLRREINVGSPVLRWHDLSLDPKIHEVQYQNQALPLTPKEYGVIELLMRHPHQVFSPGAIIDNLWAGEDPPGEEAVRTHIKGLRHKLKIAGLDKDTIKTIYGVGYCLKADEPSREHSQSRPIKSPSKQDQLKTATHLWSKFKDLAFERLANLENLAIALVENRVTDELVQAKNSAHKLAGSLGCFGFPQGSKIARQIEQLLGKPIAQADIEQMIKLTTSLDACLQHQPFEAVETLGKSTLLIVDRYDENLSQQLDAHAQKSGIETYLAYNLTQATAILEQQSLAAVIYNIVFPDGKDLKFLHELHQQQPHLPIVVLAKSAQLLDRLELVRQGSNLILEHPIEPNIAISSAIKLVEDLAGKAKVLIVDDDPQVLLSLQISLKPWAFELATLEYAQKLWNVLENFEPDILVLDIEMPNINGIELCQLLRSDRHWQHLPVLFLSVHHDETTQQQAFAIGADDYICKPVTGSVLANRIINRLQRSRITSS